MTMFQNFWFSCDFGTSNSMTQTSVHNIKYLLHLNSVIFNLVQVLGIAWSAVWINFQNFKNKVLLYIILCITGNIIEYMGFSPSHA